MTTEPSRPELAAELGDLRARLAEAQEVLRAIRNGKVDAVVVAGERGEQVYSLSGADRIYRQLIETMSEGAATLSADGVILYCNIRLAEMLGRPLDRALGTALRNYLPPADQQALDAILAQASAEPSRREINLKTSDGRLAPVYLSASRLQSEGAEMVFCLVFTDLTEQKRHEQIVAEERLARLILDQAAEAIVVCDEQGRVIRASQAAQRFCDGSPLQRPFAEVFPLRTDASEPFLLAPVLQGKTLRNVDVALDRQGQKSELILNAGPLLRGQQILGCVVTLTDITARNRAESVLRDSEERYRRLFEDALDGIALVDAQTGMILDCNPALLKVVGRERHEVVGQSQRILHPPTEASGEVTSSFKQHRQEKAGQILEVPILTKAGEVRTAEIRADVHEVQGRKVMVGIFRDITERKRLEEQFRQAQKMEAVGQLAGGVAHDFNNLLFVINGRAGLLLNRLKPDDPMRGPLELICRTGERAAALTRQLLAFSRHQVLQPKTLDLNAIVTDMDKMLQRLIREDITLTIARSPALNPIRADPGQLEQVLMNLVVNARDAMPKGGKLAIETANVELDEVFCWTHEHARPGRYVRLTVSDTGCGMDDRVKAHLFEPFFTTKGKQEGTGLGLATVFGIVKQSGGYIQVESEVAKGTRVSIYLPQTEGSADAPNAEPATATVPGGDETILLVEDVDAVRDVVRDLLAMSGYTVLTAQHGHKALELAGQHKGPIQLLLTDVVMPEMSGPDLAQRLLRLRPETKVLFMSGYTDHAADGQSLSGSNYVQKPVASDDLARKLREVLDCGNLRYRSRSRTGSSPAMRKTLEEPLQGEGLAAPVAPPPPARSAPPLPPGEPVKTDASAAPAPKEPKGGLIEFLKT